MLARPQTPLVCVVDDEDERRPVWMKFITRNQACGGGGGGREKSPKSFSKVRVSQNLTEGEEARGALIL